MVFFNLEQSFFFTPENSSHGNFYNFLKAGLGSVLKKWLDPYLQKMNANLQ